MATSNYRQIRTARAHDVVGTIKRMVSYITRKHKLLFIMSILGILISSLTGVVSSYFFKPIINDYIVPYIGKENPDMTGFIKMLTLMGIIYLGYRYDAANDCGNLSNAFISFSNYNWLFYSDGCFKYQINAYCFALYNGNYFCD